MKPPGERPGPGQVHVWFVELVADVTTIQTCFQSLAENERQRAAKFSFEHLRNAFILSRGVLRALLSRYLKVEACRIAFAYGPREKPQLAFPVSPLAFNLAHSGTLAAYAFAVDCALGIDIEKVHPLKDQEGIVRRFFSPEEYREWLLLDASERNLGFFRCWTRKEAYIKALGDGLAVPLDSFRVSLRHGEPAALLSAAGDPVAAGKWRLYSLSPAEGYLGALAAPETFRGIFAFPRLTAAAVLELATGSDPFPQYSSITTPA